MCARVFRVPCQSGDRCREIEAQRTRLATLSAVTGAAADADGGVARLQAAEKRLRADIAAAQALAAQRDAELRGGSGAAAYARLVQLKEQARKREKRRGEQEAKAARLGAKLAALQVRGFAGPHDRSGGAANDTDVVGVRHACCAADASGAAHAEGD